MKVNIVCVGVSVGRTLSRQRFRGVTEEAGAAGANPVAEDGGFSLEAFTVGIGIAGLLSLKQTQPRQMAIEPLVRSSSDSL